MDNLSKKYWFVLRDLKRPNAKDPAYKVLQEGTYGPLEKVFTPMIQVVHRRPSTRKKIVQWVPVVRDLLFVYESRQVLDPIIESISTLQYRFVANGKPRELMTVPEEEMEHFIRFIETAKEVKYYHLDEVSPALYGKRIRIVDGELDGTVGRLLAKRGTRRKQIIVDLKEQNLSATAYIESEYIELLEDESLHC